MKVIERLAFYLVMLSIWAINVNDLIRPNWFYETNTQILFLNIIGLLCFLLYMEEIKNENRNV